MPGVDPLALAASAVVLAAVLGAALAARPRVPAAAVAVGGALLLCAAGLVGWSDAADAVGDVAPTIGFLVLVLVLAALADAEGLFTWAAAVTAGRGGHSPTLLLGRVAVLAAVVTAVLSLDATVVLLVPVVLATAARLGVSARPHALLTGHLANSASLLLPVSNLTNLLAFAATGLSFLHFAGLMAGPWVAAVAVEFLVLRALYRGDLARRPAAPAPDAPPVPRFALAVVALTVAGFGVAAPIGISPAWPAAAGATALAVRRLSLRTGRPAELVRAADLPFAAFVAGLTVVVLAVRRHGLEALLADLLPDGDDLPALLAVAGAAAVLANLVNNLPATLALLPVAAAGGPGTALAILIGVNVGPNLTYAGSLANLLWRRALGPAAPGAAGFSAVGLATVPLTLLAATVALWTALRL
ncbi:SLC13 family permease [Trujillonella endophytica]|uniref:Arsenite efflux membrane protein ArsB (TC 3.A.4.1.1 TC 2.A.45.1.1) n=1 Tax=Trujillonella endophytica TaxID=673521 RepID=A0A1H8VR88_9ACTN|nr:SLC13 family permease [Trujillella endophytica]SEP17946.1 arsenite efflux membrane protein ArsB (TC 3.A.4.1.1 TC 2.A.45.1.1) [Trujillella endophytica]